MTQKRIVFFSCRLIGQPQGNEDPIAQDLHPYGCRSNSKRNPTGTSQVKTKTISDHGCILMPRKSCLIRLKQSNLTTDLVYASSAEIHGEHLVFLHADGSLAALFLLELVESWSETDLSSN
jgi:hypothetical protein